jgi:hypothetical protein
MAKPLNKRVTKPADTSIELNEDVKDDKDLEEGFENGEENNTEETNETDVELVPVVLSKPLSSYIGDTWYRLEPNKEHLVPANVKDVIRNAGYLKAI